MEQKISETRLSYALSLSRLRRKLYNEAVQTTKDNTTAFWEENARIARAECRVGSIEAQQHVDFNSTAIDRFYKLDSGQKVQARIGLRATLLEHKWALLEMERRMNVVEHFYSNVLDKKIEILLLEEKRAIKALTVWKTVK